MSTMINKVEISLEDYHQLVDRLSLYSDIIDVLTTPHLSDWDIAWVKDHPEFDHIIYSDFLNSEDIPKKTKDYIVDRVNNNMKEFIAKHNLPVEFSTGDLKMHLCKTKHIVEEDSKSE